MKERIQQAFTRYANKHPDQVAFLTRTIVDIPRVTINNEYILHELARRRDVSYVFYFIPHVKKIEPAVVTQRVIRPYINLDELGWLTSVKFATESDEAVKDISLDREPPIGVASKIAPHYARLLEFRMLTIIQSHLKSRLSDSQEKAATAINFSSIREGKRILKNPGSGIALSPEGHRNQNGGLQRGLKGMEFLLRKNPVPVLAVPMVLTGVNRFQLRDKDGEDNPFDYNPLATIGVNIGHPITYEEARQIADRYQWIDPEMGKFTVTDGLMLHAARYGLKHTIPGVDPRGVYAWKNIRTTGNIEIFRG